MKPIYEPRGAAKEYGDLALNIYTGCPHRCFYCFAPSVLRRDREAFHANVQPRDGIIEATRRQLEKEQITGKLIHLCFTCDPYPTGYDTTPTREIIKLLKEHGNHVQILTKPRCDEFIDRQTLTHIICNVDCPVDIDHDVFVRVVQEIADSLDLFPWFRGRIEATPREGASQNV